MKKYYRNFKSLKKCYMAEVCEGEGTEEFPIESVKYIYDEHLNFVGSIESKEAKLLFDN